MKKKHWICQSLSLMCIDFLLILLFFPNVMQTVSILFGGLSPQAPVPPESSPMSVPAWLLIFWLLTPLRLNSCSSDSKINLPKYTSSLNTSKSRIYLWRTSYFLWPNYISLKPVAITFAIFAVFGLTSICQLLVPLLLLSYTPYLITVILPTIDFPSLNYPTSSRFTTLLLVLLLKILSPVISLPSYPFSTGSQSLIASNTSYPHLTTKFSQLPNLHTFIASSLFSIFTLLALYLLLLLLSRRHHPLWK